MPAEQDASPLTQRSLGTFMCGEPILSTNALCGPAAFSHGCATACNAAAPAQVGIFDADVYGPSLPTMVSPELRILRMNPDTRAITPTEYEGVQLVSFGFAGQGSAIMRGAMVSGLIQQMLTTTEWGETHILHKRRLACLSVSV